MMESGLKIGALEGHAFCGKTTLAQKLRDQYGYVMVEEYARYAEGAKNFPSFPPDTYEDAKKAIDYFVELERRRSGDAVEAAQKENASVVMDRTFFSCLSFQRVVQLRMQNTPNSYLYSQDFRITSHKQE